MFSFSFPKTSRPIIIDKLGLRRFTRMLGMAHRGEDEKGAAEIDSYNNIPKLFLRGRIWVHLISSSVSRCFDQSCGFRISGYLTWQHWYRPLVFGFSWENTNRNNCSLQLRVRGFTLPRFQILARRSLFRADMLFFLESKFITSISGPKNRNNLFFSSSNIHEAHRRRIKRATSCL